MEITTKSEQIAEGMRKSFQTTDCKMANRVCCGYDVRPEGELTINETKAKVVSWIFECYLAGDSLGKIATGLERQGVLSPTGKAVDRVENDKRSVCKYSPAISNLALKVFICTKLDLSEFDKQAVQKGIYQISIESDG